MKNKLMTLNLGTYQSAWTTSEYGSNFQESYWNHLAQS